MSRMFRSVCLLLLLALGAYGQAEAGRYSFGGSSKSFFLKGSKASIVRSSFLSGSARNAKTSAALKKQHPPPMASVQNEQPLRTREGKIAKDPLTGKGRRLDHVVIEDGSVKRTVETTSMTAPKDAQLAKERRIIKSGGEYIKDRETGNLLKVPGVSEVVRHD